MESWPKVSIIVLNYNGGEFLKNCLKSLSAVSYPDLEVIVVDNGSSDGSFETVSDFYPDAVAIKNEKNLGFAAGNNVGVRYAMENGADYVLLLNQDTEVEPDFLQKLIDVAENNPKAGILSPLIFWKRTDKVWFSGGKVNWLNMKSIHLTDLKKGMPYESDFITGCSILIKREVIEKIGSLSEKFFLYWEDADFSFRARKNGYLAMVVPESVIYHFEAYSEPAGNKLYWLVYSGLIFFQRNAESWAKIWISFYYRIRKIKNKFDLVFRDSDNARIVRKAYNDFDNGKI